MLLINVSPSKWRWKLNFVAEERVSKCKNNNNSNNNNDNNNNDNSNNQ